MWKCQGRIGDMEGKIHLGNLVSLEVPLTVFHGIWQYLPMGMQRYGSNLAVTDLDTRPVGF